MTITSAELREWARVKMAADEYELFYTHDAVTMRAAADRIDELERVLAWYANDGHYVISMPDGIHGVSSWPINDDRGHRARVALGVEK